LKFLPLPKWLHCYFLSNFGFCGLSMQHCEIKSRLEKKTYRSYDLCGIVSPKEIAEQRRCKNMEEQSEQSISEHTGANDAEYGFRTRDRDYLSLRFRPTKCHELSRIRAVGVWRDNAIVKPESRWCGQKRVASYFCRFGPGRAFLCWPFLGNALRN